MLDKKTFSEFEYLSRFPKTRVEKSVFDVHKIYKQHKSYCISRDHL